MREDPFGTNAQPEDDYSPNGVLCYVTGNGGGPPDAWDVDHGPVTLRSPIFDLTGIDPYVRYARWSHSSGGETDALEIEITNDQKNWVSIENITESTDEWQLVTFRVADYVEPSTTVRLRFRTSDIPNNSVTEALIDQFRIFTLCPVIECTPADVNNDQVVDDQDVLPFVAAVLDPEDAPPHDACGADVNQDDALDGSDVELFVACLFDGACL